jgi:hypothetical protein
MNWENSVIAISAVLYGSVGVSFLVKGQYSWALVWICYSLANFGLMLVKK